MLILLEFNELCPTLLKQFMDHGDLPNFQRLYDESQVFTTDAGESAPNLEPWIQWVTVHSGMPYQQHGVFHLGDGRDLKQECVAKLLSNAGVRAGVLGSMNTNYQRLSGYFVPDPWDKNGQPQPTWLRAFYDSVSHQVQDSSGDNGFPKGDMLRFGWFLARHGMRPVTATAVARQLIAERRQPGLKWRRASVLEQLQYDLFRWLNRRFQVQFASLFCNSTAHYQHYYWRNMEPELFERPPDEHDDPSLDDAILYGYREMDHLLGRALNDYPQATIMMCTALSQQAWTETVKCTYRPCSFEELLAFAETPSTGVAVKPVMAEEFQLDCSTEEQAKVVEQRLRTLQVADAPLMRIQREGAGLYAACDINEDDASRLRIVRKSDGAEKLFGELFHLVHSMRSGRHHPDGAFWVRRESRLRCEHTAKVPLTDVAPTILRLFDVPQPAHMSGQPLPI